MCGGSGSRPRWTISEDAGLVIRKCRDVVTAAVVLFAELQKCDKILERTGAGGGRGFGWGAMALGGHGAYYQSQQSLADELPTSESAPSKKDASLSAARPERAWSQPRRPGVWLGGARRRYQAGNSGASERKSGSGRSEGR